MYKGMFRMALFTQDAEEMYETAKTFVGLKKVRFGAKLLFGYKHSMLRTTVAGIEFANPVGLAAGFDTTGELVQNIDAFGFGAIEVGTVTPLAQEGNPKPRLFRLPNDYGILSRMGWNNDGVEALARTLNASNPAVPVGVNIGKNTDTSIENAVDDYMQCLRELHGLVDYIAVNPQALELYKKEALQRILDSMQEYNTAQSERTPLFLKLPAGLTTAQLEDVVDAVQDSGIAGVIATDATTAHEGLRTPEKELSTIGDGNISGKPLRKSTTECVRTLYTLSGGAFPIIGVGGIFTAQDAYDTIRAGASLVQVYSGWVYEGPSMLKQINKGLVELLKKDGFSTIADAVGVDAHTAT